VDLHEVSPVGRWATGGRDGRWFERFAEMCKDLPDRPRIGNERDEADVATTPAVGLFLFRASSAESVGGIRLW